MRSYLLLGNLLGGIWFRNLVERNGSVQDSENAMALLRVWRKERSCSIFCLVLESERMGRFYPLFGSREEIRHKIQ
jgi:hypothetical protein